MEKLDFYINGAWVKPSETKTIDVINPATEEAVATISLGSQADVNSAVSAAKSAFESYSLTSIAERIELLTTIREIYKRRIDDVADAIQTEMGAPTSLARGAQAMVGLGHLKQQYDLSAIMNLNILMVNFLLDTNQLEYAV